MTTTETTVESPPSTVEDTTTVPAAVIVDSPATQEARFVRLINSLRTGAGLQPLLVDAQLTAGAKTWAAEMAAYDQLVHAPDLSTGVTAQWTVLAENIGHHTIHDVDALFGAFVNSGSHYRNLVDPRFHYLGVGVVHGDDGTLWTTHRFMATSQSPTTAPPTTAGAPTTTATTPSTTTKVTAPTNTRADMPQTTLPSTTRSTTTATTPATTSADGSSPSTTTAYSDTRQLLDAAPVDVSTPTTQPAGVPHDPAGMADLVQPDIATIEVLLIDLLAAGM